jgi:Arc/MetJ family transcription regulator
MRTNIEIDDDLMKEAMRLIGSRTKRETVETALRELVARQRRLGILDLVGKVEFAEDPIETRRRERGRDWSL